jgi:2-polyprenyl-3-methyl-5-hydroxy-6-metoxy-1,4-benzoquinol methylase
MTVSSSDNSYALGSTDAEHERLILQAARLAPCTERFFREAGIGRGQRVLDVGSGVGDVAMLAAQLVGPSGEVVGVERDSRSVARAKARVAEAGLNSVSFTQCDVSEIASDKPFDATVGRFILQFISDPVAVLRSLSKLVRPGGVLAFQEVSYAPFLLLSARLPLWSTGVSIIHQTLRHAGANTEIGLALNRIFQEAGIPAPTMRMEILLGSDPEFTRWTYDLICSLRPQIRKHNVSLEPLGDFDTLPVRLQSEVAASKSVVPFVPLVGAWSRKPTGGGPPGILAPDPH